MPSIRVLLFEDNYHLRESLYFLIGAEPDMECVGALGDCLQCTEKIAESRPDVVLMDIELPGMNGIEAVASIRKEFPEVRVLMQTIFQDDTSIFNAMCAGASGYLLKSADSQAYLQAIRDVHQGGAPMSGPVARRVLEMFQQNVKAPLREDYALTQKEREVLASLVEGKSFKMIADSLGISYETVRSHMKNIYSKLHVHSNTEAVIKALRERIV